MGCDIHAYAETRTDGQWAKVGDVFPLDAYDRARQNKTHGDEPFGWRDYGMFAFLAGVRSTGLYPPITERRGFPADASGEVRDEFSEGSDYAHTPSWLTAAELLAFDYDAPLVGSPAGSMRELLGDAFFEHLAILAGQAADPADARVVFWFDN